MVATGTTSEGRIYYRCEKCGRYHEGFITAEVAKRALRTHMIDSHNNGE